MRHQFIIDCESPDRLPDTNVSGEIAGTMARVFLRDVTITRCRINDVDEPEAGPTHRETPHD
jgi:hypothetical protein